MTNMSTGEFLRGVDHAAAMNDRWLFIASLVVIGLFGVWVVSYFVKQHERLLEDHKESRECYQESLRGRCSRSTVRWSAVGAVPCGW